MSEQNCACGCGRATNIAKYSHAGWGYVRGEPVRFFHGHGRRRHPETETGFLAQLSISDDPDGCREWTGDKHKKGYGRVQWQGRMQGAHVVAWTLRHGPVPKGSQVLHKCDVRSCCNTDHLFLGTNDENMADMVAKGRQAKGERIGSAKLREKDIAPIRLLAQTMTKRDLATMYGVSRTAIAYVVTGRTWRHVAGGVS